MTTKRIPVSDLDEEKKNKIKQLKKFLIDLDIKRMFVYES
jgi:hypothetical protein